LKILQQIADKVVALLICKNKDYGNSYEILRDRYGPVAFHVRLADKLFRLENVEKNGDHVGETIEDTIKDIIGYCLLELKYRSTKQPVKAQPKISYYDYAEDISTGEITCYERKERKCKK